MTRDEALRKYDTLLRMTQARGCSPHEEATARNLARALHHKYGLSGTPPSTTWRPEFDARFSRAEERAAARFAWEYRRCGKRNCWCARARRKTHGPYRYSKSRQGKKVSSIYIGR